MRIIVGVVAVLLVAAGWLAVRQVQGIAPDLAAASRSDDSALDSVDRTPATTETPRPSEPEVVPRPKLVVDYDEFDFGVMNVGQSGRHTFTVRNAGNADLVLHEAGTTCKCTLVDMPGGRIKPGEERQVRLEWTTEKPTEHFRHGAGIWTNDPKIRQLKLVLTGKVRAFLSSSADSVVFPDVAAGEWRTQRITVFSQHWKRFNVTSVESSLPNLTWRIEPADADTLAQLEATSGYTLELKLDPDLPRGGFGGRLRIATETDELGLEKLPDPLELPVQGNRLGNYSFYGKIVQEGVFKLGRVAQRDGIRHKVYMYVRGATDNFQVEQIRTTPDFLHVRLVKDDSVATKRQRYRMEIEVPPGAPLVDYMAQRFGRIELDTNHPDLSHVELTVQFAVHP